MKTFLYLALIVLISPLAARGAVGIYAPAEATNPSNNGNASLGGLNPSSRLQQVYGRDGFPFGIPPDSGFLIHVIYFRTDESSVPISGSASFSDVEFRFSTTSREPDGLSTLFSENIGPDETTVFGRGSLNLNWSQGSFVTGIPLDRPFLYNPAAGNLLLDMRNYGAGDIPSLDAFAVFGDSVSIVGNEEVNSPVGDAFTHGLATLFWVDIVPIPEPSTTALLFLVLVTLGWKFRRFHKSSSTED